MKALRILMIHPDSKTREVVSAILEKAGHAVAGAADGAAGLKAFRADRPDMVILNERQKAEPAYRIFSEIKELEREARILTFSVERDDLTSPHRAPFGVRPFRPGEAVELIHAVARDAKLGAAPSWSFTPRILVVDDDAGVRATLSRFLTKKGYETASAVDGIKALPLFTRLRPHLVMLDVDMPVMDGVETLRRIREIDPGVAIMMITGNSELEMMSKCKDLGAYDYVLKPFDFEYMEFSVYSKIVMMTI